MKSNFSVKQKLGRILLAAFFAGGLWSARAGAYVEVDPTVLKITVPAGGTYSGKIRLSNPSQGPMEITRSLCDWKYSTPDGGKDFLAKGTSRFSCTKWLSTPLDKIKLQPGETQNVSFTLSVPADAAGGYYSMIVFGSMAPKDKADQQKVQIGVSIDVPTILMVEVEKTQKPKGSVEQFEAESPKADRPFSIAVRFRNEGNVRIEAKGRISIVDKRGNAVGWIKVPELKTLPGDVWTVKAPWENPLPAGQYQMVGTFELSSGGIIVKESTLVIP
jgi:hypothetical protein